MPIYEYQCAECGHQFDRLQKIADAPLVACPECEKDTLIKLVSAPSFRLSGSGWYETDFKTDKDKKKNLTGDASKDSGKSSEKSNSTTAESAVKKESKDTAKKSDTSSKSTKSA